MKKHTFLFLIVIIFILTYCSCASSEQPQDIWSYKKDDGTWPEFNRKAYLQVMYVYENLRPDEALTEEQLASSTDEQLLRLIDADYKAFDTEPLMPRADEVQYDEMKQIVLSMVETFHIADKAPDLCFSSLSRDDYFRKADPQWITMLCYEDGYHFRLLINAKDGSFQGWQRFPQGTWTYRPHMLPEEPQEPPEERTDDELLSAAEAYAEAVLVTEESDIIESATVVTTASPYVQKDVTVILHPHYVYQISIDYDDLSISSVKRK